MARQTFGGDLAAFTASVTAVSSTPDVLVLARGVTGITVWTARTGGTQVTDLQDLGGSPISTISSDGNGLFAFLGPDGIPEINELYVDAGFGARQYVGARLATKVSTAVQNATQVIAGTGLTGGGALTGDVTLAVGTDTTVQRLDVAKANTVTGTRRQINFIDGANLTFTVADNPGANRVDVSAGVTLPTGAGYTTIEDEGAVETARSVLNFVGAGVTVTDDSVNGRTNVNITGSATVIPRPVHLIVAGADAPTSVRAGADYLCDGSAGGNNDQVEINSAIAAAFRTTAGNHSQVRLVGNFRINASILAQANVIIEGTGMGTVITSVGMATGRGMIESLDKNQQYIWIRDLTLWGNATSGGGSHGIYLIGSDVGGDGNFSLYDPGNSPDMSPRLDNLFIKMFSGTAGRTGIFLDDNVRDANIHRARINTCTAYGMRWNGASDAKVSQCIVQGADIAGYLVAGASNQFIECKAAFCDGDGWQITSSRAHLTGCHAQDNGKYGYTVTGATPTMGSCVADSNMRLDQTGAGFNLNVAGMYDGLDVYDRNNTPASRQTRGINLGTSIGDSYMTGKVSIPSGTNYVVGTAPTGFARVVRVGSTLYSVG